MSLTSTIAQYKYLGLIKEQENLFWKTIKQVSEPNLTVRKGRENCRIPVKEEMNRAKRHKLLG
jgi:hypothetical protein